MNDRQAATPPSAASADGAPDLVGSPIAARVLGTPGAAAPHASPGAADVAGAAHAPDLVPCPDCRALVPDVDGPTHAYIGGIAGCWAAWGELQARAYAEPALAAVVPLAVDAYAAQHPGVVGRRQAQSAWVHLVSLCLVLERGRTPVDGIRAKQRLVADDPVFPWLAPPADPGPVTVLDVAAASGADAAAAVRRWAGSVWAAWSAYHPAIRGRADELDGR